MSNTLQSFLFGIGASIPVYVIARFIQFWSLRLADEGINLGLSKALFYLSYFLKIISFPVWILIELSDTPFKHRTYDNHIRDLRHMREICRSESYSEEQQRKLAGVDPREMDFNYELWLGREFEKLGLNDRGY